MSRPRILRGMGVMAVATTWDNALTWAVLIGWILSVVLHEFAHGLVGYWGGDYTIRERGGLTLNPFQYIDPLMSIAMPALVFLMGGIPLPGGVTYIRTDLLRSKAWDVATSAAGPLANCLIFLALVLPFHPKIHWLDAPGLGKASNWMLYIGAMAWLQGLSVLFNLLPVPPLDGFRIVATFMDEPSRRRLSTPPLAIVIFLALFFLAGPLGIFKAFHHQIEHVLYGLGFHAREIDFFGSSYNQVLFGSPTFDE